jgi:hypothetical protein
MKLVSELVEQHLKVPRAIAEAYNRNAGDVTATARELNVPRSMVKQVIAKLGAKKPVAGGTLDNAPDVAKLPPKGKIKRYIVTSAQNNTIVNDDLWENLLALAKHWDAEIMVGTFTYNQNNFGHLAVKRGQKKDYERELWYDPRVVPYLSDSILELGKGLLWCGNMNILPTNVDPLSGLATYGHRKSTIFPHVKVAMRSIATMQGEGTKLSYTTGTVTLMNYVQKKEGIKAEHHHIYGALVVEVDHDGYWCVRQLSLSKSRGGYMQDLDVVVRDGKVTTGNRVEAITWGDLHGTAAEPWVVDLSQTMLDALKPKYQFLHDVMEGVSTNRHVIKHGPDGHYAFNRWLRGLHRVDEEIKQTVPVIERYKRPFCETIVPDSNHDGWWLRAWLQKYDYRFDPANSELFLDLQTWFYAEIRRLTAIGKNHKHVNLTEYVFKKFGLKDVNFLLPDQTFKICDDKIECGMHGHLGPNGSAGSPRSLSEIGRRANTAHTHSAGIYNGLYVAGTSSKLEWSYTYGPSSWGHHHIVTYPNGMRSIVTMWNKKWRA